jgi:spore coat protein A
LFRLSRRALLRAGVGASGLAFLPRCKETTTELSYFETPRPIPRVLTATSTDATTDFFTMTQKSGFAQVVRNAPLSSIEGFEGTWPGPTLLVRKGRKAVVTVNNQLKHRTVTHNHGHKAAPDSDGHPVDYVQPGASKVYTYPNDQHAGTYWYHDHTMDETGRNVWAGLAGYYIIHDDVWDSLNLPSGEFDVPLMLQDRILNDDNTIAPLPFGAAFGDAMCVNGAFTPRLEVAARKYLFRFLNASSERPYLLHLAHEGAEVSAREPMVVVASDGGLLAGPIPLTDLPIAPAERYDVVIDFSRYPVGSKLVLGNALPLPASFSPLAQLMRFDVVRAAPDTSVIPSSLPVIERLNPADAPLVRRIEFDVKNNTFYVNGLRFDPSRVDCRVKLNTTEVWEIVDTSGLPHTFHLHLVPFQVVSFDGGPPLPIHSGWKDTVFIPALGSVRIVFKPLTFTGIFVFHCHMLAHEDNRMMGQMEVVA